MGVVFVNSLSNYYFISVNVMWTVSVPVVTHSAKPTHSCCLDTNHRMSTILPGRHVHVPCCLQSTCFSGHPRGPDAHTHSRSAVSSSAASSLDCSVHRFLKAFSYLLQRGLYQTFHLKCLKQQCETWRASTPPTAPSRRRLSPLQTKNMNCSYKNKHPGEKNIK